MSLHACIRHYTSCQYRSAPFGVNRYPLIVIRETFRVFSFANWRQIYGEKSSKRGQNGTLNVRWVPSGIQGRARGVRCC